MVVFLSECIVALVEDIQLDLSAPHRFQAACLELGELRLEHGARGDTRVGITEDDGGFLQPGSAP